jgi:hypothetical protein
MSRDENGLGDAGESRSHTSLSQDSLGIAPERGCNAWVVKLLREILGRATAGEEAMSSGKGTIHT